MKQVVLVLMILLASCSSKETRLRHNGRAVLTELVAELETIETVDELIEKKSLLRQQFLELTSIAIAMKKLELKRSTEFAVELQDQELSDRLQNELNRLYRIPGAKSLIEVCQEPALEKIDAFEAKLQRPI